MGMLRCGLVEATAATQIRKKLLKEVIDQYHEDLGNGAIFPAIDVFRESGSSRYILADGFHRLFAHIHADRDEIEATIHEGGMQEALIFAAGSNSEHGFRRTNADKRNAVEMCLKDPEISLMGSQEIADICRVTKRTVNKIKHEQMSTDEEPSGNGSHPEPQEPTAEDFRPTRPEPTQEEVERGELRAALSAIKAFPYDGPGAVRLDLSKDDIADLAYVSSWCSGAVIELQR
jgi:hypothetical protein